MNTVSPLSGHIEPLNSRSMAERISAFLLSPDAFDDMNHTPGELLHFSGHPLESLQLAHHHYWYMLADDGGLAAVSSAYENEQRTGGYVLDYLAVHRLHRNKGIASRMMEHFLAFAREAGGRYVLTSTCDLPSYDGIRQMFAKYGYEQIGYCPDYYFAGEGRMTYLLKL